MIEKYHLKMRKKLELMIQEKLWIQAQSETISFSFD